VTVWFNAWQYEKEEHPIVPLIATILRQVELKQNNIKGKLKQTYSDISRALRAIAYGFSAKGKVTIPGFGELEAGFVAKEMIERYEKLLSQQDPLLDRSIYYNAFELLENIQKTIESNTDNKSLPKIIVFIDDLDRCLPDKGLMLLESIKLVLAQKGFVFVLAVDRRIIEGYLEKKYREEFNVSDYAMSGTSYLDKIVQLPLNIPPHDNRFEEYLKCLLDRPALKNDRESFKDLIKALTIGSDYNPRSLVRFINNLLVDKYIYKKKHEQVPDEFLQYSAVSRILQQHLGYQLYRHLVNDDDLCNELTGARDKSVFEKKMLDERRQFSSLESKRNKIWQILESKEFLLELLKEPNIGSEWLKNKEMRKTIDEFLVMQRSDDAGIETQDQKSIIDKAIKSSLSISDKKQLSPEDLNKTFILDLDYSNITDGGLKHLSSMTSLESLSLDENQITDEGLKHLSGLTTLKKLSIGGNQITDEGLTHLSGLTTLKELSIGGNQITDEGLKFIKSKLLECNIIND